MESSTAHALPILNFHSGITKYLMKKAECMKKHSKDYDYCKLKKRNVFNNIVVGQMISQPREQLHIAQGPAYFTVTPP